MYYFLFYNIDNNIKDFSTLFMIVKSYEILLFKKSQKAFLQYFNKSNIIYGYQKIEYVYNYRFFSFTVFFLAIHY